MSSIFISHSSQDNDWAIALRDWLVSEGWGGSDDIFLDLDPERGIAAGQRWQEAFADAATRCEAVLFLISREWLKSRWCYDEFQLANKYNKKLFAILVDDSSLSDLPGGLTSQWQVVNLVGDPAERFIAVHPYTQEQSPVHMATTGLAHLKTGLKKAGVGPENFDLQKDDDGPFGWRSPYRGLQALDTEDAAVFFGRNADIIRGLDTLRGAYSRGNPQAVVILGASGSGKSSLLRAGLWPRLLRDDAQWLPLKPIRAGRTGAIEGQEGLLFSLQEAHKRFGLRASRSQLRESLRTDDGFVHLVRELRAEAAKRLVNVDGEMPLLLLCLDQCEEFFGPDADAESEQLLRQAREGCLAKELLILATIRSDSYSQMQKSKAFAGIEQVPISLGPVPLGEIAGIIRDPAELLRQKVGPLAPVFEAAAVERLQEEIKGEPDALPLLAFLLQRLMLEHIGENTIGLEQIEASGGISQAIELEAQAAFRDAGYPSGEKNSRRETLRTLFVPSLARIRRDDKIAERRVASYGDLAEEVRPLARALTQRRLLVVRAAKRPHGDTAERGTEFGNEAGKGPSQDSTIEVAHEALLHHWKMLSGVLGEDRESLLLLDNVLLAAADWQNADSYRKPDFLVHRGSRLINARALAERGANWAQELARAQAYLAACEAYEKAVTRQKRRLRLIVGALVFAIVGSSFVATFSGRLREALYWFSNVRPYLMDATEEARALMEGIAFKECRDCPEMMPIRAGVYQRGGPRFGSPDFDRESPTSDVEIRYSFAVSVNEITFSQWDFCAANGGCRANVTSGRWGRGEQPVVKVRWQDAQDYASWISDLTGQEYRLLSESEWEYAARGGTKSNYSFQPDNTITRHAWYADNSDARPHKVGELAANPFGLKDMHGNVAEWVEDCFHSNYRNAPRTEEPRTTGPNCDRRVIRGGNWLSDAKAVRSASRDWHHKDNDSSDQIGFRIARQMWAGE